MAMKKLITLVLAWASFGSGISATAQPPYSMSCLVDPMANDEFTPEYCFAMVPNARYAKAVFKVDGPLPDGVYVLGWGVSDGRTPLRPLEGCKPRDMTCTVMIQAYRPTWAYADILDSELAPYDEINSWSRVFATAEFEAGN
jgi:hypothetical protein